MAFKSTHWTRSTSLYGSEVVGRIVAIVVCVEVCVDVELTWVFVVDCVVDEAVVDEAGLQLTNVKIPIRTKETIANLPILYF
jgi:hypothetical protein